MAWNVIFAFLSGTWRGFGGDGIGLHKAFLVVPQRGVEVKIFILTSCLVEHWNRRSIIDINEFLTTSPRAIPLVLASLCRNCPLTFNLLIYFQQVIVSLSIFCCKYFLVVVVRNRFYLQGLSQTLGRSQILCLFTKKGTNR